MSALPLFSVAAENLPSIQRTSIGFRPHELTDGLKLLKAQLGISMLALRNVKSLDEMDNLGSISFFESTYKLRLCAVYKA